MKERIYPEKITREIRESAKNRLSPSEGDERPKFYPDWREKLDKKLTNLFFPGEKERYVRRMVDFLQASISSELPKYKKKAIEGAKRMKEEGSKLKYITFTTLLFTEGKITETGVMNDIQAELNSSLESKAMLKDINDETNLEFTFALRSINADGSMADPHAPIERLSISLVNFDNN